MSESNKHFFLRSLAKAETYRGQATPISPRKPERDRLAHSQKLLTQFNNILNEKELLESVRTAAQIPVRAGTYLCFSSAANYDLTTKSLESINKGIRLLNIQQKEERVYAVVYIPKGLEGFFIKKIQDYRQSQTKSDKPKNASLVESIEDISMALVESLWTDKMELMPNENEPKWCEIWLRINLYDPTNNYVTNEKDAGKTLETVYATLETLGIEAKKGSWIVFPERVVLLVRANKRKLSELMLRTEFLAELRAGQEPTGFWVNERLPAQDEWLADLRKRLIIADKIDAKVCILDSGCNSGHPLLEPLFTLSDTLTVNSTWGTDDHESGSGHGTLMAGVAGYGHLESALLSTSHIQITHQLCSVKILPPSRLPSTGAELWGNITEQGVLRAEIESPNHQLIHCMAVTSEEGTDRGKPSSWSGALDNLAYGEGERKRLILVSAGNIKKEEMWQNYPNSNQTTSIQSPAQAWNVITVGAYTDKIQINDPSYAGYTPLAQAGELSPYSTTSLVWEKKWPIKPDVVFEGGNMCRDIAGNISGHENLEILSTSKNFSLFNRFSTFNATSAATAHAAWFAAKITHHYPHAWPETIRGLMVHTATWREAMYRQLGIDANRKKDIIKLLRVFGYGIPDLGKALYNKESAFTYIIQEEIQPFTKANGATSMKDIHILELPWPKDLLLLLENTPVRLRITLSYFIEAGEGRIGWKDKYRYASHGFRFDLNNTGENKRQFRQRINVAAREEERGQVYRNDNTRWTIGVDNRSLGSLHSDIWNGTASELATCNYLAVYPVIGWWRERANLKRESTKTRYSLIISLETPADDIPLYNTVKTLIDIPISIRT